MDCLSPELRISFDNLFDGIPVWSAINMGINFFQEHCYQPSESPEPQDHYYTYLSAKNEYLQQHWLIALLICIPVVNIFAALYFHCSSKRAEAPNQSVEGLNPDQSDPLVSIVKPMAAKIELEDCEIDWRKSAQEIHNLVRGDNSEPAAWCYVTCYGEKKRLRVYRSEVVPFVKEVPGTIASNRGGVIIACGQGGIRLQVVQIEGGYQMTGRALASRLQGGKFLCSQTPLEESSGLKTERATEVSEINQKWRSHILFLDEVLEPTGKKFEELPIHAKSFTRQELGELKFLIDMKANLERGTLTDGTPYLLGVVQSSPTKRGFLIIAFIPINNQDWIAINIKKKDAQKGISNKLGMSDFFSNQGFQLQNGNSKDNYKICWAKDFQAVK